MTAFVAAIPDFPTFQTWAPHESVSHNRVRNNMVNSLSSRSSAMPRSICRCAG